MKTLGSSFMAYKNKKATKFVLDNFKKNFSTSPVFLISDGGDDFSDFEKEYTDLKSTHLYNILGNEFNNYIKLPYESFRMKEYWRRIKSAIDYCNTVYLMILEDDVFVTKKFDIEHKVEIAGRYGPPISSAMKSEIYSSSGLFVERYGMCGGSVINTKTFLKIYDDVIRDIDENHDNLLKNKEYFLLGASDANLVYHFTKRGYFYSEASWLAQLNETPDSIVLNYPVIHNYKKHYDRNTSNGAFI